MEFLPVSNYRVFKAKAVDSSFGLGHNLHYCIKAIGTTNTIYIMWI